MGSGYTYCACPSCFDVTVSSNMGQPELCADCEDAGCDGLCGCRAHYGCEDIFDDEYSESISNR